MVYLVGREIKDKKLGMVAAGLWSFSYLANVYDRHFWALYWGPLVSLVVIFSLHKIIKGHHKFVYLLAATIAFAIHADLSNLLLRRLARVNWGRRFYFFVVASDPKEIFFVMFFDYIAIHLNLFSIPNSKSSKSF